MAADLARTGPATGDAARRTAEAAEIVRQLRTDFAGRDRLYRYVDAVLYGDLDAEIPRAYARYGRPQHNPLAIYFTNTITAALTVNPPAVQFPTLATGSVVSQASEMNASLRERFFEASWERQEEEAEAPLFRRFTHAVVCKGEGILKTVPRTSTAWADYQRYAGDLYERLTRGDLKRLDVDSKDRLYQAKTEEYKRLTAPYPIRSIDVPPETFQYFGGDDGLTTIVERKEVPYLAALTRYGASLTRDGTIVPEALGSALPPEEWGRAMSGTSRLTLTELWRWNTCEYYLAGPGETGGGSGSGVGRLVRTFSHRYGDPVTRSLRGPYAHCLGTTTASRLPERAGLGVLYGFLDLFVTLDELLTVQQINAVLTGLASFKRNTPPTAGLVDSPYGEDGREVQRTPVRIEPGAVLPYDVGPIEMPRAGEALPATIAQIREFVELILPKVLQGVVDTTDSGYQLALAARLGRIAFDPMVSNIRRAAARRVGFESWLIEHEVGETVYAYGTPVARPGQRKAPQAGVLAIGPDDLNGIHRYRVRLAPEDKTDELVQVRTHAEKVQNKFESTSQAIEAMGGSPEEVEIALLIEQTKQDPDIQAQLKQRIAQKIQLRQQAQQAAGDTALAMAQPPGAPGAALQGMGDVHEPGMGGQPLQPGGPGQPSLPASIPGAPPGVPPVQQQVNPNPNQPGIGVVP